MASFDIKDRYTLGDAVTIVRILRDPVTGCPWDREQTHESIRQNFLEETYEALDAIDRGDPLLLEEELGDVLLQVLLHAEMERQTGRSDIDDIADRLCKKLVLRHPHIFGDVQADTSDRVLSNWEDIKRAEKSQRSGTDAINDVPRALPALMRSQKVQKRAAYTGFDYTDIGQALSDLESEVAELKSAIESKTNVEEELGDLIFSAVNVARFAKLDAERTLELACDKFADRFKKVEALAEQAGCDLQAAPMDKLNELWRAAKTD